MSRKRLLFGILLLTAFLAFLVILAIPILAFAEGDTIPLTFPSWLLPIIGGVGGMGGLCGGAIAWGGMRNQVTTLTKDMDKNTKITEDVRASVHNSSILHESALGLIKEINAYLKEYGRRLQAQEDRCEDLHPRTRS